MDIKVRKEHLKSPELPEKYKKFPSFYHQMIDQVAYFITITKGELSMTYKTDKVNDKIIHYYKCLFVHNYLQRKKSNQKEKISFRDLSDGLRLVKHDGVFKESGSIVRMLEERNYKGLFKLKKPITGENHIGLEIELISPMSTEDVGRYLAKTPLAKCIRIMSDSSIRTSDNFDDEYTMEMCLLLTEKNYELMLDKVGDVLAHIEAYTNDSCGLHVHLDARQRSPMDMYHKLVNMQDVLFKIADPNRRLNRYCRPVTNSRWEESEYNHYAAINRAAYDKYRTIEVRIHEGTINITEIKKWIKLLINIVNSPIIQLTSPAVDSDSPEYKNVFDNETLTYLKEKGI